MIRNILTSKSASVYRSLVCTISHRLHYSTEEIFQDINDIDDDLYEFLKESRASNEKKDEALVGREELVQKLKETFGCKLQKARYMVRINKTLLGQPMKQITDNIETLARKQIKTENIMANVWLLGLSTDYLKQKFMIIEKLNPRDINDYFPLARLSTLQLMEIRTIFLKEQDKFEGSNRIYFISEQLKLEPAEVSTRIAKNLYIMEMTIDRLKTKMRILMEQGVPAKTILQKLPIPTHQMVNYVEPRVNGYEAVVKYLSERLGYDIKETEGIVRQITPYIDNGLTVKKIKKVLDYLLIEENLEPLQIASNLLVVAMSVKTLKKRLADFKSLGMRPTTLSNFCKSKKEYEIYLNRIKRIYK